MLRILVTTAVKNAMFESPQTVRINGNPVKMSLHLGDHSDDQYAGYTEASGRVHLFKSVMVEDFTDGTSIITGIDDTIAEDER
jgi:hypothetical protein